jgi:membrane protein YqaA with SNARE-associated domain
VLAIPVLSMPIAIGSSLGGLLSWGAGLARPQVKQPGATALAALSQCQSRFFRGHSCCMFQVRGPSALISAAISVCAGKLNPRKT